MEKILKAIEDEKWNDALEIFLENTEGKKLDASQCVIGATILEQFDDRKARFDMILAGLKLDPFNYELYLLFGNYYAEISPKKALLTYENALYYAKKQGKSDDAEVIENIYENYKKSISETVNKVRIMVLDYGNNGHLNECLDSIKENCYEDCYELSVVDVPDIDKRLGIINESVKSIDPNLDILFLTSDVILMPGSLYNLRMALYDNGKVGTASCTSNYAYFKQTNYDENCKLRNHAEKFARKTNLPSENPQEERCVSDMSFMLMKGELAKKVFPIEENYKSESVAAMELGLRIIDKGYLNFVCWNSYVYRYENKEIKILNDYNAQEYDVPTIREKWGFFPGYYLLARIELVDMIDAEKEAPLDILEVGAGLGSTLANIKYQFPNANVHGIELVDKVAAFAAKYTDMECGNIEEYEFAPDEKYDYVIFGDVLEHLVDPYALIENLRDHIKPGGGIITSIPNILNARVIHDLLHGNFTYADSGILDRTHLRFFTKNEIDKLFETRGYTIAQIKGNTFPSDSTATYGDFFDKLCSIEGVVERWQFDIIQYLLLAKKRG